MKVKIHIIQYEHGGIPDEPDIFTNKKQADAFFLKHFNEEFKKDYKTVDAAYEYQMSDRHHGEDMLRYWSIPITIPERKKKGGKK